MPQVDFSDGALIFLCWVLVDVAKQAIPKIDPRILAIVCGTVLCVARAYAVAKPESPVALTVAFLLGCGWTGAILGLSAIGIDQAGGAIKAKLVGEKP
jgi:hypothetical protein